MTLAGHRTAAAAKVWMFEPGQKLSVRNFLDSVRLTLIDAVLDVQIPALKSLRYRTSKGR